jgi:hypothetical protein
MNSPVGARNAAAPPRKRAALPRKRAASLRKRAAALHKLAAALHKRAASPHTRVAPPTHSRCTTAREMCTNCERDAQHTRHWPHHPAGDSHHRRRKSAPSRAGREPLEKRTAPVWAPLPTARGASAPTSMLPEPSRTSSCTRAAITCTDVESRGIGAEATRTAGKSACTTGETSRRSGAHDVQRRRDEKAPPTRARAPSRQRALTCEERLRIIGATTQHQRTNKLHRRMDDVLRSARNP